jgi:hypothetical protein
VAAREVATEVGTGAAAKEVASGVAAEEVAPGVAARVVAEEVAPGVAPEEVARVAVDWLEAEGAGEREGMTVGWAESEVETEMLSGQPPSPTALPLRDTRGLYIEYLFP